VVFHFLSISQTTTSINLPQQQQQHKRLPEAGKKFNEFFFSSNKQKVQNEFLYF